jgi:diguanylate cyclase (GGDEF)-like protein
MNEAGHIVFTRRVVAALCFCLGLASFYYGPELLALSESARVTWMAATQIGGPFVAMVLCLIGALRAHGRDRSAWLNFALGSFLYLSGNLYYLYCATIGVVPSFPTVPEAAYFVMALFFARGMSQLGSPTATTTWVPFYNFILTYCAIAVSCLFLLHQAIEDSVLTSFGSIAAVMYPSLWLSVAAFGIISLSLYDHGKRLFPYLLLLGAIGAEAVADFVYAFQLMNGTYALGGTTQILWVASAGLISWAALEGLATRDFAHEGGGSRDASRIVTHAAVPAAAIAMIMLSGSMSGAFGWDTTFLVFATALGLTFAIVAGLREHRIIQTQLGLRDASERSHREASQSRGSLSAVLEATSDSVIVLDRDGKVEFFNANAAETLRELGTLMIGSDLWAAFSIDPTSDFGGKLQASLQTHSSAAFEQFVPSKGIWLSIHAFPTAKGMSIFFRDVSEQRRVREEIHYLAHHDPLTGTANRTQFRQRLEASLGTAAGSRDVAILCLDLDDFKTINDTLGHPAGDALLVELAARLKACTEQIDLVARMGGDEFAILCVGARNLDAFAASVLQAVRRPFELEGQVLGVRGSIGIALASEGQPGADQLIKNADIALYAAKAEPGEGYRFFEPEMELKLTQKQLQKTELAAALDNCELELVYQPIIDLEYNRVSSFEALLRWRHPQRGLISPANFIPVAEETGLILPIGEWVLTQACLEAARWPTNVGVAVNLSAVQFRNKSLSRTVAAALAQAGLAADRLELEITETILLNDSAANLDVLHQLRKLGVKIALDDFGTGYSSLAYLRKFPFTKIKIDRSFVADLEEADDAQAIVRAITELGRSLGMTITAEGIETRRQLDRIREKRCNEAQGYFFSRPVTPLAVLPLIEKLNADRTWWRGPTSKPFPNLNRNDG